MRIPTTKLDLSGIGYEGYFVVMPRSVKEGFVYQLGQMANPVDAADTDEAKAKAAAESGRDVNIKFLELITEWNLDDDSGKPLPLVSSVKTREKKAEIVAEVPVEVIRAIAERLTATATATTTERVKGF